MTPYSPRLEQGGQEVEHGLCAGHGGLGFPLWILPSSVSTIQCYPFGVIRIRGGLIFVLFVGSPSQQILIKLVFILKLKTATSTKLHPNK